MCSDSDKLFRVMDDNVLCCFLGNRRHFAFAFFFFLHWAVLIGLGFFQLMMTEIYISENDCLLFFSIKIHDLSDLREMYAIINLDDENKGMLTVSMRIKIFTK